MAAAKNKKNRRADGTARLAKLSAGGRKRENAALFVILFFLFLFAAAAVSWVSIARKTETKRRLDAYGEWKAAFYGVSEEEAARYAGNPVNTRSGISRIVGGVSRDGAQEKIEDILEAAREKGGAEQWGLTFWEKMSRYAEIIDLGNYLKDYLGIRGTLGTLDAGCVALGRITMEEGRLPEGADEIAMTRPLLLRLGFAEELGQEICLEVISDDGEIVEGSWKLSGILGVYGGAWDTAGCPLASAVISEEALAAFPWEISCHVFTDVEGATGSISPFYNTGAVQPVERDKRFVFKKDDGRYLRQEDGTYIWGVLSAVFLAAAVTVFQLLAVQMRKRSRQVGLLKAIGATNGQIRRIFLRELAGICWRAALAGTAAGAALVPAVLWGSGAAGKSRFYYDLNLSLLLGAAGICFVMAQLGALLPVWKGSRIPIRGEIAPKTAKVRPMKRKKRYSAGRLVTGRESGGFRAIVVVSLTVILSAVFLAAYQVEKVMAPYENGEKAFYYHLDYYLIAQRYMGGVTVDNRLLEQLSEIPGVKAVYTRKNGVMAHGNFYVSYEGIEDCRLERLRKERDVFPYSMVTDKPYKKKDGLALATVMGICSGWERNLDGLEELVTEGSFDREAFEAGEEVLLFLPSFREADNRNAGGSLEWLEFNTDARYRDFYEAETCVKPGDTITLVVNEEISHVDTEKVYKPEWKYAETREVPVKVGGIIRYLPDTENPLWNEAYTGYSWKEIDNALQPFAVVADGGLVNELRHLDIGMRLEFAGEVLGEGVPLTDWQMMAVRGENGSSGMAGLDIPFNSIEVLCDASVSELTRSSIESLAEDYRLNFQNEEYKTVYEVWKLGYQEALDQSVFDLTAAATAALIFGCLLVRSVRERFMEDRRRFGIFQALGIRWKEIRRDYLLKGLVNGLAAMVLAHGIFLAAVLWQNRAAAEKLSSDLLVGKRELLLRRIGLCFGAYDWRLHLLACVLALGFASVLYLAPLREVLKKTPVENIRELGE